jgi:small GTP-binding protein
VRLGKVDIDLLIWDTAGQEAYRGLTSQYYRDAKIALVVFDLSNPVTLNGVKDWHARLLDANQSPVVVVIIGNRSDFPNRQISREQGEAAAAEIKAIYRETSALTGRGITEVFEDACEMYVTGNPGPRTRPSELEPKEPGAKKRCCSA